MKEVGWLYCSELVSDCPPGESIPGWKYYYCQPKVIKPHWHKVYETEEGKVIIDWDVLYEMIREADMQETYREFYRNPEKQGGRVSALDSAERKRCADKHLCQSCKKKLVGDGYHSPYWIPLCKGFLWCDECWKKHFPGSLDWCHLAEGDKAKLKY